jgi:hypothetical protein
MRETEGRTAVDDARVEEACPACAGPIVVRPAQQGVSWIYCRSCRRLSQTVLLPGPTGGAMLIHQLAAA